MRLNARPSINGNALPITSAPTILAAKCVRRAVWFPATVAGFIVAEVASSIRLIAAALAGKTDPAAG
jgi:hypothetical protein